MPRKQSKPRSQTRRDGITIRDRWSEKGRNGIGARWLYMVRDRKEKKYLREAFSTDPEKDKHRKGPGCAEGDGWAEATAASLALGQKSAAVVTLQTVGKSYIDALESNGKSEKHRAEVRHIIDTAVAAGIETISDVRSVVTDTRAWLGKMKAAPRGRPFKRKAGAARAKRKVDNRPVTSARTRNKYITILRGIGKHAVEMLWLQSNPFMPVKLFKEDRKFRDVYTIEDLRTMLVDERKADRWYPFVMLAAYTGLRSETLRSLRWDMVDWKANRIRVPAEVTKARSDVRVPIQPELRKFLDDAPGVGTATILPESIAGLTSHLANVEMQQYLSRCKITSAGRSVHCFRHSVASLLTATGQSPFLVMDAIGHASTAMSKHYSHGADEYRNQVKAEGWPEGEFFLRRTPPALMPKAEKAKATGD